VNRRISIRSGCRQPTWPELRPIEVGQNQLPSERGQAVAKISAIWRHQKQKLGSYSERSTAAP
jgi:hypothetical protein